MHIHIIVNVLSWVLNLLAPRVINKMLINTNNMIDKKKFVAARKIRKIAFNRFMADKTKVNRDLFIKARQEQQNAYEMIMES